MRVIVLFGGPGVDAAERPKRWGRMASAPISSGLSGGDSSHTYLLQRLVGLFYHVQPSLWRGPSATLHVLRVWLVRGLMPLRCPRLRHPVTDLAVDPIIEPTAKPMPAHPRHIISRPAVNPSHSSLSPITDQPHHIEPTSNSQTHSIITMLPTQIARAAQKPIQTAAMRGLARPQMKVSSVGLGGARRWNQEEARGGKPKLVSAARGARRAASSSSLWQNSESMLMPMADLPLWPPR